MNQLPEEIIRYIFAYENPYKTYFNYKVLYYIKQKTNYKKVLNQIKSYTLHDINHNVIRFSIESLLG
jgi:hypothetical protein